MKPKSNPPQPDPSLDSRPYWESLKQGKLALQRCVACREWQFPAIESCRHCAGKFAIEPISGRGEIYAFIINHRPAAPGFDELLPYPIALVSPEENPELHIPGRIVGASNESVAVGQAVQAEVVDLPGSEWKVPVFRVTG
jgi:uncharacterized OB-fold protein